MHIQQRQHLLLSPGGMHQRILLQHMPAIYLHFPIDICVVERSSPQAKEMRSVEISHIKSSRE